MRSLTHGEIRTIITFAALDAGLCSFSSHRESKQAERKWRHKALRILIKRRSDACLAVENLLTIAHYMERMRHAGWIPEIYRGQCEDLFAALDQIFANPSGSIDEILED